MTEDANRKVRAVNAPDTRIVIVFLFLESKSRDRKDSSTSSFWKLVKRNSL